MTEATLRNKICAFLNKLPASSFEITRPGDVAGKSDLTGCFEGRYVCLEIKKPGSPGARKLQKHWLEQKRLAGAVVGVVRSLEDVEVILVKEFS